MSLFVVSERAIIDRDSGNLTLVSVADQINAHGFPLFISRIAVSASVRRASTEPEEFVMRMTVTEGNHVLFQRSLPVSFDGQRRLTQIVNLEGLVIPEPGEITFSINLEATGELPFTDTPGATFIVTAVGKTQVDTAD